MKKLISIISFLILTASGFAADHKVSQKRKQFSVDNLTIKAGDTITFTNEDPQTHHLFVRNAKIKINTKQSPKSEPISFTFTEPEELTIRCAIHPKMKLQVKVEK